MSSRGDIICGELDLLLAHKIENSDIIYSDSSKDTKYPQRNNLCNLLVIGSSISDSDAENQDILSDTCIVYSVTSPN